MSHPPKVIVFTDLDGTLLDADTYCFQAAGEALSALRARQVALVLVSSKTRAEMEAIRSRLGNDDPFIIENGSAVYIPKGLFGPHDAPTAGAVPRGSYDVIKMGTPYPALRNALKEIERAIASALHGFGDMSAEEIAAQTGLNYEDAVSAKQREYDEPFLMPEPPAVLEEVRRQAEARGLRVTRGGRFCHLAGNTDKGHACQRLLDRYRGLGGEDAQGPATIGLGDAANDAPMLAVVDYPVAVQRPDGTYDPALDLPGVVRAPGVGPAGWNRAVLELLGRL